MDNFFATIDKMAPLAERMRATVISEFIGQKHIVSEGSLLSRAIKSNNVGSCIFWGPPGTGKTTLANIISNATDSHFEKLNAVLSGVKDAKRVIDEAVTRFQMTGKRTYLLLDECHRWSKAQSDCVLQAIERGYILFIGSTTENPYAAMTPAIVSRCRVFEFHSLSESDIALGIDRVLSSPKGYKGLNIELQADAKEHFVYFCGGDLRNAYNALELAVSTTSPNDKGVIVITKDIAVACTQSKPMSLDKQRYYDMISAFIKSMRGSDCNAAMFWFTRLIEGGCDPLLLARRICLHASEDVGLADPMALVIATSALTSFQQIGLPEGRLMLSEALLYVCNAPKSNSVVVALDSATESARRNPQLSVPMHLADSNFPRATGVRAGKGYKYPHDYGGYVAQQYLPDEIKDEVYYKPSNNGREAILNKKGEK